MSQSLDPDAADACGAGRGAGRGGVRRVARLRRRRDRGRPDPRRGRPRPRPRRSGSLWRDGNFLTLWGGQALSQFGAQITELAMPGARGAAAARDRVRGRRPERRRRRRVPGGRAARRRLDRPHAQAPRDDLGRRRAGRRPRDAAAAVVGRRAADVAPLRRRARGRGRDRLLRRVVPEHHPLARAARADRRGERQARVHPASSRDIAGPAIGGWLIGVITAPFAILATVGHLPRVVRRAAVHPRPRAAARRATTASRSCARSARGCAGSSAIRCCAASWARPACRTSSAPCRSRCCRSSCCANSDSRPASMGVIFSLGRSRRAGRRGRDAAHRAPDRRGPRDPGQRDRLQRRSRCFLPARGHRARRSRSRCWWCRASSPASPCCSTTSRRSPSASASRRPACSAA